MDILQEQFKKALAIVAPAVASKTTLPILANVLIEPTEHGRVRIAATNLAIGISTYIPANIDGFTAITLPFALLRDTVNDYPNDVITFEIDTGTNTATLRCAGHTSSFKGIEADEMPTIPTTHNGIKWFDLQSDQWQSVNSQVALVAAKDENRPTLACVAVQHYGDNARFQAADGFRLARLDVHLDTAKAKMQEALVPRDTFSAVAHALAGTVSFSITDRAGQAIFDDGTTTLVSRIVEGKFPDADRIIPKNCSTRAVLNSAQLSKSIKIASRFAATSANIVKLDFRDTLTLTANAAEIGNNASIITCDSLIGESFTNALNSVFLQDAVTACKSEQVAIEMTTAQSPVVMDVR